MIVSCLGYGYISVYLLKEISANGAKCFGITNNQEYLKNSKLENISVLPRNMASDAIERSTHLVITAPPDKNNCPVLLKHKKNIINSNVRSIVYVSTTGVYGDHKGGWVDEKSLIKKTKNLYSKLRVDSENDWITFCKKFSICLNIVRLGAIYGPGKPKIEKNFFKNIVVKENHFFSRIHVFDISRLICKVLNETNSFNCWNIVDELPSTREEFINRIINLKNIKSYNFIQYEDYKKHASNLQKRFWESNKRVNSIKIKEKYDYTFLFPNYISGLKFTINES